jgi:sulfite exporter TauE/SafE
MVELMPILMKGIALGLSTGVFCSVHCLPVLVPVMLMRHHDTVGQAGRSLFQFLLGRLVAYLLVGAAAGALGSRLESMAFFQSLFIPIAFIVLGCLMIAASLADSLPHMGLCHWVRQKSRGPGYLFFLGFLLGINLCPPFVLAIGVAAGTAQIFKSIVFFMAFFAATSIYLLPLLLSGACTQTHRWKLAARVVSIATAICFVGLGGYRLI